MQEATTSAFIQEDEINEILATTSQPDAVRIREFACYRLGRQGENFMGLAKPGDIKTHCGPNGLSTFIEYLEDFATPETRKVGEDLVARQ